MVKLLIVIFLVTACATSKKVEERDFLTVKLKDNLFSTQNDHERFLSLNDPLFLPLKKTSCSINWNKSVVAAKKKILRLKKLNKKAKVWYELGNCYTLVGEFKKSLYYYDLVLATGLKDTKITSKLYYNMGQIYEASGQTLLALSYYQTSYELDDPNSFSLFKLALINHRLGEFSISNKWLKQLSKRFPESETVKFLLGVNFYHLSKLNLIKSKVIRKLDEKSNSRALLVLALELKKNKQEDTERDISKLDLDSKLQENFRDYLLAQTKG